MSRVGKKPIQIPEGVEVKISDGKVMIKGPKGDLSQDVRPEIGVEIQEGAVFVSPKKEVLDAKKNSGGRNKQIKSLWGLTRALLFNNIKGVVEGYEKKLEIQGVGYRAELEGERLVLQIGFSHPVKVEPPEGIKFLVEKNIITISGINKRSVGQSAAEIRHIRPPEPYKGKGIRYLGEVVKKKVGKKAVAGA